MPTKCRQEKQGRNTMEKHRSRRRFGHRRLGVLCGSVITLAVSVPFQRYRHACAQRLREGQPARCVPPGQWTRALVAVTPDLALLQPLFHFLWTIRRIGTASASWNYLPALEMTLNPMPSYWEAK